MPLVYVQHYSGMKLGLTSFEVREGAVVADVVDEAADGVDQVLALLQLGLVACGRVNGSAPICEGVADDSHFCRGGWRSAC